MSGKSVFSPEQRRVLDATSQLVRESGMDGLYFHILSKSVKNARSLGSMLNATRPTHKFIEKLAANASEAANPDMPFGVFVEPSDELQLIGLCKVDLGNGSALPGSGVKVGHFQGVPELGDPSKNFSRGHLDLLCRCLDWQRVVGIELK